MARRPLQRVKKSLEDIGLRITMVEVRLSALEGASDTRAGMNIIRDGIEKVVDIETGEEVPVGELSLTEVSAITNVYSDVFFRKTN